MWNPRTYHDEDFGLGEGESFEPKDYEDEIEGAPTNEPHIMTLLGPILPEENGICLPHVHLMCDPPGADEDHRLIDAESAESEVEAFVTMNGRSLVECSTRDAGRMLAPLIEIAGWVPAHLISVTGRHNHFYAAEMPNALDRESLAKEFVTELTEGMDDTDVRAGMIKVGTSLNEITEVERTSLQAAADAHVQTGAPITTHTENGTMALELIEILELNGAKPDRVVIGHVDRVPMTFDQHIEIARTGAYLQFDQIGKSEEYTDQMRAERVVKLIEAGYGDQILLSLDYARRSLMVSYDGKPGLPYLSEWFMVLLLEAGMEAMDVRKLVIDNPARALTIHPPASPATTTA